MTPVRPCVVCSIGTTAPDELCVQCRQLLDANRHRDRRENEGARAGVRPRNSRKRR
jgi:predicted nucleic acid-binding Zn ribbon protein